MNRWERTEGTGGTQISSGTRRRRRLDAERSEERRVADGTSPGLGDGRAGGDGRNGEQDSGVRACLDGGLERVSLQAVSQEIGHTEGGGSGWAGLCCEALRWLLHPVAVGHCAAGLLMLETLCSADEGGGLGQKQSKDAHHNGCRWNPSRE